MSKCEILCGFSTHRWKSILRLLGVSVAALFLVLGSFVRPADAHAELVRATPEAGDQSDQSPASVEMVFNERLDSAGFGISVLNEKGNAVTSGQPERIEEGKGLRLVLPKLSEGHYTVSYHVISADGHPVSGAYVFTVGHPAQQPGAPEFDPHQQVGHSHNHGSTLTDTAFVVYTCRILYYAGLLVTSGLVMWGLYRGASPMIRQTRDHWLGMAGKFMLLATLAYIVTSMLDLLQEDLFTDWYRILTSTTVGRLYLAELLLALAAPMLVQLGNAARLFWAYVFIIVEAWSGHAAVYTPKAYTVALDIVHLAAASLWSGGLVLLIAVWQKERPEAGRFALVFSRWALYSFLLLWLTGTLSVLAFLPSASYLFYTAWGKWLLAKIGISLVVAVIALFMRGRLRKGSLPQGILLKADVGLMAVIVFIVGIMTYQSPLPANEPLHYHEMGTDMHYTLRISPNAPGDNTFTLKVWLRESAGNPKHVALRLLPLEREDVGYIDVPLAPYQDEEIDAFPGYGKFTYQVQGPFLPFAGKWKAQVRVTDAQDHETVKEMTFRIY